MFFYSHVNEEWKKEENKPSKLEYKILNRIGYLLIGFGFSQFHPFNPLTLTLLIGGICFILAEKYTS